MGQTRNPCEILVCFHVNRFGKPKHMREDNIKFGLVNLIEPSPIIVHIWNVIDNYGDTFF
jgi:hypothetical protein